MTRDRSQNDADPPCFWRSRFAVGLLVLVLFGFLLQWPTLLTLLMFPILLVMYGRLAVTEEAEMRAQFGEAFDRYAARTPRFIPHLRTGAAPSHPQA